MHCATDVTELEAGAVSLLLAIGWNSACSIYSSLQWWLITRVSVCVVTVMSGESVVGGPDCRFDDKPTDDRCSPVTAPS